jgi:hypothetical protein
MLKGVIGGLAGVIGILVIVIVVLLYIIKSGIFYVKDANVQYCTY